METMSSMVQHNRFKRKYIPPLTVVLAGSALFLGIPVGIGDARAQTPPDAGALRRQIEQESRPPLPTPETPRQSAQPRPPADPAAARVTVREFRFSGNTRIADDRLQAAVRDYLDRPLDFSELQQAAQAVSAAYREAGWIVRSSLPRQDVTAGTVTIRIDEARFGTARLDGEPPLRLRPDVWQAIVDTAQPTDAPLSAPALDRALLLLNDLPGVAVAGNLTAGQANGQTDLLVKFTDTPLFSGHLGADNAGTRSTGHVRYTASLTANSPLRLGDQLQASLIHTEGNNYGRIAYSLPVGSHGLRVGANVSNLDYRLVGAEFKAIDAAGDSRSFGLEAGYPLIRGRRENLYLSATVDRKRFDNEANDAATSRYDADVATLGLFGNRYDDFAGGGVDEAALILASGRIRPDTLTPRSDHSNGSFTKFRWSLSRQQAIAAGWSAYVAWSGQWTNDNLDSSEKFYLGGISGVRAYPVQEGYGSRGQLINLELRRHITDAWLLTGFYDWGRVRQYERGTDIYGRRLTGNTPNTLDYQGYGLSLTWQAPFGAIVRATWARRHGNNPLPANTGKDQDGTLHKDRFWLSLSIPFQFGRATGPAIPLLTE